jgi:hypothetical protein
MEEKHTKSILINTTASPDILPCKGRGTVIKINGKEKQNKITILINTTITLTSYRVWGVDKIIKKMEKKKHTKSILTQPHHTDILPV